MCLRNEELQWSRVVVLGSVNPLMSQDSDALEGLVGGRRGGRHGALVGGRHGFQGAE